MYKARTGGQRLPNRMYRYRLLDVFTDVPFGGNQLAVFPHAEGLDTADMQRIARELNLSECAFAFARNDCPLEWTLRIFTPGVENPFAGHPTIGAAIALADGRVEEGCVQLVLHEAIGPIEVAVSAREGLARLELPTVPEFGPSEIDPGELAEMLGIGAGEVLSGSWSPAPVSCGIPYYIVAVSSLDAARRATLRLDLWRRTLANHWAPHVYVITRETERRDADFHVRMFPPAMAVSEDPATGSAAAALAGFVARAERLSGRHRWMLEQGLELGRPSLIELFADTHGGIVRRVSLAGRAIFMGEGCLRVPS